MTEAARQSEAATGRPTAAGARPSAAADESAAAPVVVWRFLDGKPGHEKQSAGLVEGLAELMPLDVRDFDARDRARLLRLFAGRFRRPASAPPAPDLLIGVGHATHVPMLLARLRHGGRCLVLMKPSLPAGLFDLVFVPRHDRYQPHPNVIGTRGVICSSSARATAGSPNQGLVLLGGPSRHFDFSPGAVAEQIAEIAAQGPTINWQMCDSRRTPPQMRSVLPEAANLVYRPWQQMPSDFLARELTRANYVWVTADSASMLYEALAAGARVGIIEVEPARKRDNKHARGIRALRADGLVASTADGYRLHDLGDAPRLEPENARCARIVAERLLAERRPRTPAAEAFDAPEDG